MSASQIFSRMFLTIAFLFIFSGCSSLNGTRMENLLGADINLISLGNTIADDLSSSAMPPLRPRHPEEAILVSTFVDLSQLKHTSQMGRLLQTHIGTRMVQLGYTVKEINLRNTMEVTPGDGETMLSRELSQIDPNLSVQAVLVGTYSMSNRTLYITAKLINPVNRNIISAQSYKLIMDDTLLAMFGLKRHDRGPDNSIDAPSESLLNKIFF